MHALFQEDQPGIVKNINKTTEDCTHDVPSNSVLGSPERRTVEKGSGTAYHIRSFRDPGNNNQVCQEVTFNTQTRGPMNLKENLSHASAVFRKWYEKDFRYVLQNHVHRYYIFEYVQKMYAKNIFPVCVDNIHYDKASKPPIVHVRQAGHPKENRIRHRSECIRPEDSKIKCGRCGHKGHNKRTCMNEEMDLSLGKEEQLVRSRVLKGEAIKLVSII
jgi:hypothetical protein